MASSIHAHPFLVCMFLPMAVQAFRLRRFLRLASLDLSWPFHPLPDALFRDLMASLPPLPLLESATLLIQAHRQG
jgi:hypothetical protein